jgi:hypothetical protein
LDPFGKVSYYEATLKRVPIQTNDKTINWSIKFKQFK